MQKNTQFIQEQKQTMNQNIYECNEQLSLFDDISESTKT